MKTIYLFDVDGTLTPARQPMVPKFENYFRRFVAEYPVYLISGSDYSKLQEQVPQDILDSCEGVFGCSGSQYYEDNELVFSKDHSFSKQLMHICESYVDMSEYSVRTGTHIEKRPGMLNVSVVGRQASVEQRRRYFEWDQATRERKQLVDQINKSKLPYEASAGGEISIDIVPTGWNKSVAKDEILSRQPGSRLVFFGDRICEGGNDLPLAEVLRIEKQPHCAISVEDYQNTWFQLDIIQAKQKTKAA